MGNTENIEEIKKLFKERGMVYKGDFKVLAVFYLFIVNRKLMVNFGYEECIICTYILKIQSCDNIGLQ